MNTDIRLKVTFFRHPKTVKLQRKLGLEGVFSLLKLWLWVAENKPEGILDGSPEDIEIAAEWTGNENEFYDALIDIRFLVKHDSGAIELRNWKQHNAWVASASERSLRAKKGGCKKHGKSCDTCTDNCPNSAQFCYQQEQAPTPSPSPSPIPLPSPSPLPSKEKKKKKVFVRPTIEDIETYCKENDYSVDAEKFIDYYNSNGWKVGRNAMKDWKAAVRNWHKRDQEHKSASTVDRANQKSAERAQAIENWANKGE
jgi:hypothetical protein